MAETPESSNDRLDRIERLVESNAKSILALSSETAELRSSAADLRASLDRTNEFILATNAAVRATNETVTALVALAEAHDLAIQQLRNR